MNPWNTSTTFKSSALLLREGLGEVESADSHAPSPPPFPRGEGFGTAFRYRRYFKPAIDRFVAGVLLLLAAPVLSAVAVAVRLKLGSPVLFRQERIGQAGRPFHLRKFRTMTNARDATGRLLPDEKRLTRFGRWLRGTSLDELPELWNVLCGEMSLVGPRPLLPEYLACYTPEQARRHDVKPGLTGWAQVQGRNQTNWEERLAHDVWYVCHLSPGLDLKILLQTVMLVLTRRGISATGHATMPRFDALTLARIPDERVA
jgi:sugar transferase EpsL